MSDRRWCIAPEVAVHLSKCRGTPASRIVLALSQQDSGPVSGAKDSSNTERRRSARHSKLRCLILAHVVALALSGTSAWAHDSDMRFADWMKSLRQPDFPLSSCCGPGDQYFVREYWPTQRNGISFAAIVLGQGGQPDFSIDIPQQKVIWDRVNPTGRGVIFIADRDSDTVVLCFVPGAGL